MVVPKGEKRDPKYRVRREDLAIGEKYEMRYVRNRTQARRIARRRLQEHPTYYDVVQTSGARDMRDRERNMKALPKKKKARQQPQSSTPPGWNSVPWEGR
jgi:hypothetical protein